MGRARPSSEATRTGGDAPPYAWVAVALVAFAGNSLLCRDALPRGGIDPATFTLVRIASGAVASGLGYAAGYAALPRLEATPAAVVPLAVPVLAAAAAIPLLSEAPTVRIVAASATILGGIALTLRRPGARPRLAGEADE